VEAWWGLGGGLVGPGWRPGGAGMEAGWGRDGGRVGPGKASHAAFKHSHQHTNTSAVNSIDAVHQCSYFTAFHNTQALRI